MNTKDSRLLGRLRLKIIKNWGSIFWKNILKEFEDKKSIKNMSLWAKKIIKDESSG